MAYTVPLTAVDGVVLTAAQWNASVRDNILETGPAKATASGRLLVSGSSGTVAERIPTTSTIATSEATASTSYTNLATTGPFIDDIVCGTRALVLLASAMRNSTVNAECYYGVTISGATSLSANDNEVLRFTSATANAMVSATWSIVMSLSSGTHDFLAKYKVSSGTGTYFDRSVSVVPF